MLQVFKISQFINGPGRDENQHLKRSLRWYSEDQDRKNIAASSKVLFSLLSWNNNFKKIQKNLFPSNKIIKTKEIKLLETKLTLIIWAFWIKYWGGKSLITIDEKKWTEWWNWSTLWRDLFRDDTSLESESTKQTSGSHRHKIQTALTFVFLKQQRKIKH